MVDCAIDLLVQVAESGSSLRREVVSQAQELSIEYRRCERCAPQDDGEDDVRKNGANFCVRNERHLTITYLDVASPA